MFKYKATWRPMPVFTFEWLNKWCDLPFDGEKVIEWDTKMTAKSHLKMLLHDGHRAIIEKDNGNSWVISDSDLHKVFRITYLGEV